MSNYLRKVIMSVCLAIIFSSCSNPESREISEEASNPNIILIYADDLGYGDMGAYGSNVNLTPNLDKLAEGGMRFTDGHASSATCTPSRYALLTGSYPWRNSNARILPGTAPLLIDTAQHTIASMLSEQGYVTGIVGKWHLGLGNGNVDWNSEISPGPNELGFDYSHILAATQDRVPTVYIEAGFIVGLDPDDPIMVNYDSNFAGEPTGVDNQRMLTMKWHHGHNNSIVNGIGRIGFMKGGKAALWDDYKMADHFLEKSIEFVRTNKDKPFFLYYALQQPHVPRTPNERFSGASGLGPRGDVIVEADWCIGALVAELEKLGLIENTLIIFSSDNGPVLNDGYYDEAVELNGTHTPWGPYRGGKYSLYEAGTRVPFFTYWKGKIGPGTSDALITQIDIFSSLATLTGSTLRGPDSMDLLETLLGNSSEGRESFIHEAIGRSSLRLGSWKYIPAQDGPPIISNVNIETGISPDPQLYDLSSDPGERKNLVGERAVKSDSLEKIFNTLRYD